MICCSFKDRNNNEDDSNLKKEVEEYFQSINLSAKKLSSEKKETLDGELHNITYLEYLLRYLAVEFEKGKNWIADFYKELNNHNYSSEEHWCHLFQWSEFEIKYKPFCLNINGDYKFYPQSDYFKYKITKEINSEDNTIQYKIYKEKIYVLVEIIKDHLLDNNHPINFILNSFRNHFSNYLQQNIIELNSLKKNNLNNDEETKRNIISVCKGIIEELQNFIIQTTNILGIMYKNVNNSQIFFDESDEFNNLITGILFSNNKDEKDDLYTLMLELINIMIYDQSKKFGQILLEKKNISP